MINFHNVDCMDFMREVPDKYYELAITDPPYGINVANMDMGAGKSKKCCNIKNRKWKPKDWDIKPNDKYFDELIRISKNQIIWGGNYFNLKPTQGFIIWDKQIDEQLSFSQAEYAWISFQTPSKIFKYSVYVKTDDKIHPTQKPVKLYRWLLQNYAKAGDKIIDTHGGSMSIAIACDMEGFDLDICEIDKEYFDAGVKRFNEYKRQLTLF